NRGRRLRGTRSRDMPETNPPFLEAARGEHQHPPGAPCLQPLPLSENENLPSGPVTARHAEPSRCKRGVLMVSSLSGHRTPAFLPRPAASEPRWVGCRPLAPALATTGEVVEDATREEAEALDLPRRSGPTRLLDPGRAAGADARHPRLPRRGTLLPGTA